MVEEKKSKPSTAAKNQYNAKAYDRLNVVVSKGRKAELQVHAEEQGESLNDFIVRAVDETIERDNDENSPLQNHRGHGILRG